MLIKEATYRTIPSTRQEIVNEEIYGCDECKKELSNTGDYCKVLPMAVFLRTTDKPAVHLEFCSWKCLLKYLPKIESDYFSHLPMVTYESTEDVSHISHLIKVLGI